MPKNLTKRLAFVISFLMIAFIFCQGMAQAAVVASGLPQERSAMSCHDEAGSPAADAAVCPSDCQSLAKALDSFSQVLSALDYVPILIGILLLPADESSSYRLAALSPPDPSSDPPLAIRFQRFRL